MSDITISESKLEEIIYNHVSGVKYSNNIGNYIYSESSVFVKRQFSLGSYGTPDILSFDIDEPCGDVCITIFELKKEQINKEALIQVLKYKAGVRAYLEDLGLDIDDFLIKTILIGGSISRNDRFHFMPSAIDDLEIYTYDICPDTGITITDQNNWHFTDLKVSDEFKNKLVCADYAQEDINCKFYHFSGSF